MLSKFVQLSSLIYEQALNEKQNRHTILYDALEKQKEISNHVEKLQKFQKLDWKKSLRNKMHRKKFIHFTENLS